MIKYIKPPDFKSVKEFEAHYKKIESDIAKLLTDGSASTSKELNENLSKALNIATSYLSKVNSQYAEKELRTAFQEGKERVEQENKISEKEAFEILKKQGYKYTANGLSRDTYIELQKATVEAGKELKNRINSLIKELRETGQDSVYNVQQAILKDLQNHNILEIKYSNGAKMPLNAYAAMAARSARIESANIGTLGRALQAGTDLVKMTTMPQCCRLCGAYQGKVYSISGKDKRFPALFKTVLRNRYALPHPNCRHEFIPWFEEQEDPADVEKAIKNSKIKYDKQGNLVDVRFQKDIELYAQWQAGNRQRNEELLDFQRMQKYYGKNAPYKTLGAFRREARKPVGEQSNTFRSMRSRISETNRGDVPLDRAIPLKQERIKGAQYEAKFAQSVPASAVHIVAVKSRQILRENNRKKEETAVCVSLATGEVLFEQHAKAVTLDVDQGVLRKQLKDSVILTHNHPSGSSFSELDLEFMGNNPQIHTMFAVSPDGKVFSLRTNCGKTVDRYIVSEYNRYIGQGASREDTLCDLAKKYGWEYKEL